MNVNTSKIELVAFTDKRRLHIGDLPIKMVNVDRVEMLFSDRAKYLGVILEKKLNWNLNTEVRTRKGLVTWYT